MDAKILSSLPVKKEIIYKDVKTYTFLKRVWLLRNYSTWYNMLRMK
jgi:hypothetical protein